MQSKNAEKEKQPQRGLTTSDWQTNGKKQPRLQIHRMQMNGRQKKNQNQAHTYTGTDTQSHTHSPSTHENWFCWMNIFGFDFVLCKC